MKITICGSMQFHKEMSAIKKKLDQEGHVVYVPSELDNLTTNEFYMKDDTQKINAKIEYDFIRDHFFKIQVSEAILVLNYDKNGIPHYIGGNTFLEMGYAFGLGKKIFLLYPIPEMEYKVEMHSMQPIVLNGDLTALSHPS